MIYYYWQVISITYTDTWSSMTCTSWNTAAYGTNSPFTNGYCLHMRLKLRKDSSKRIFFHIWLNFHNYNTYRLTLIFLIAPESDHGEMNVCIYTYVYIEICSDFWSYLCKHLFSYHQMSNMLSEIYYISLINILILLKCFLLLLSQMNHYLFATWQ